MTIPPQSPEREALRRPFLSVGWLVGRLTSPLSTKIGYIGDKVLGGDLVPPYYGWPTIQ